MEDVKLYVEWVGVDLVSGVDICIVWCEFILWYKDIVVELINQVFWCGVVLIIVVVLIVCDDCQVSYFFDYVVIFEQFGIWIWLFVFFLLFVSEIEMMFNLDSNFFYVDFSVVDGDKCVYFESVLGEECVVYYVNFIYKSWCKMGKIFWNSEVWVKFFFII